MSDPSLNYYNARGASSQMTAFTPSPATPAAGPLLGYIWYATDQSKEYVYDFAGSTWIPIAGGVASVNVSAGTTSRNLSNVVFSNSNGVTFGLSGSTITGTVKTDYQTSGAYLTTAMQSNAVTLSNINVSAGTTSNNLSALTVADSNGISFGLSGSVLTGTVATNYQSVGAYLTTAALSQDSSKYAGTNGAITGGSITVNTSGVSVNLPAYLTTAMLSNAATISNVKVSAGTLSNNLSAVTFGDSNGVSWGLNTNSVLTATVKTDYQTSGAYLTTAMASGRGTDFVQATAAFAGTNASGTINSTGISVSVNATVAQSNQTVGLYASSNTYLTSSGTVDARSLSFRGDKSITVGVSAGEVLFSVGAYLTTAMASNRGTDFVQATAAFAGTSASGTINSTGISVSIGPYITTADLSANSSKYVQNWKLTGNTSGTTSSANGTDLWLSGGNSLTISGSGQSIVFSVGAYITTADLSANSSKYVQNWKLTGNTAGTTSSANGTDLWLSGGNSLTISGSGQSLVFSVGAYLTTAALSGDSSKYAGINGAITGGSITVNTSGVSVNLPAYLTTAALSGDTSKYVQNWKLTGNTAGTTSSANGTDLWLSGGNSITVSGNGQSIVLSVGAYLTTGALSGDTSKYVQNWKLTGNTAGTTSSANGTDLWFSGGNSITVSGNGQSLVFSVGNYLTTARASTDAIGLNTAQTNVTWTVNSSGVSLNAGGYAGTVSGATNASVTVNTSGVSVNVPFITGSYFANFDLSVGTTAITQTSGSSIWVQPFFLPYAISVGFIRMLASLNDSASGTAGTTNANATFSCERYTTIAAVVYSQGVGASSRSLQSVTSSSEGLTGRTQYQAGAQGSQYTITIQKSYPVSGTTSSYTSSYAVSSASIVISSNSNTLFTGLQWLDLRWGNSLKAGNYWLGIGASTSSASQSSGLSFCGTAALPMSLAGMSQTNISFGVMGGATSASDHQLLIGAGMWSTNASGISTGSIGMNSVSQVVSNPMLPFQLVRWA